MSTRKAPPTTIAEILGDERLKELSANHAALQSIAERSPSYDLRQMAKIVMRVIEIMRGDDTRTELIPRHHA